MDELGEELRACAGGDRHALKRVFEAEGPRLLGVALRILRRRDLAEEAVQETFVRIWRNADRFDPARGTGSAWIYAILRNRALTILRDVRRIGSEADPALASAVDPAASVSGAWERLDEHSDLMRCLRTLDADRRVAILMAYVLGYTHGEIAGRLGAPLGTTKSWLRRGLTALRECLS